MFVCLIKIPKESRPLSVASNTKKKSRFTFNESGGWWFHDRFPYLSLRLLLLLLLLDRVGKVGVVSVAVFPVDNERAIEIAGGSVGGDCGCGAPPACKFVELTLALTSSGGAVAVNLRLLAFPPMVAFVFAFPLRP